MKEDVEALEAIYGSDVKKMMSWKEIRREKSKPVISCEYFNEFNYRN